MAPEPAALKLAPLGLGLVGIGRVWGAAARPIPTESDARALLEKAFELGIQVFDTAPAYGLSERRLGAFLKSLTRDQRRGLFIATKFGEHWSHDGSTRVDHSYETLMRSLDRSVELLGDIDLLQVHKASVPVLQGEDLHWALEAAKAMAIPHFGASVSEAAAGLLAVQMGFGWLQMPLNLDSRQLEPLLREARTAGARCLINRPFANGAGVLDLQGEAKAQRMQAAFAFLRALDPTAIVLTGTASLENLVANHAGFYAR